MGSTQTISQRSASWVLLGILTVQSVFLCTLPPTEEDPGAVFTGPLRPAGVLCLLGLVRSLRPIASRIAISLRLIEAPTRTGGKRASVRGARARGPRPQPHRPPPRQRGAAPRPPLLSHGNSPLSHPDWPKVALGGRVHGALLHRAAPGGRRPACGHPRGLEPRCPPPPPRSPHVIGPRSAAPSPQLASAAVFALGFILAHFMDGVIAMVVGMGRRSPGPLPWSPSVTPARARLQSCP